MADQDVPTGAPDSTIGDPLILNGLVEMLRNGQGEAITRMVHEAISKVIPSPSTPVSTSHTMPMDISRVTPSMQDRIMPSDSPNLIQKDISRRRVMPSTSRLDTPITRVASTAITHKMPSTSIMPSDTPNAMQKDISRRRVMPSIARMDTPITRVASREIPHNMPSTSNMAGPSILDEMDIHAPIRSTSQFINNPSSLGSVRILPPTPEQVALRSLIESQSRTLRLLPDTLENAEYRKEILKQIELWKRTLLGSAGLTSDEQETNEKATDVPIGASTSTPKTSTISLVTTKGTQAVTILLSSEGDVLKDEMGMKFFHFIYRRSEQLFGNTIQMDWRKQARAKKDELFKDVILAFGNPGFDKENIVDIARKYIHSKRDNLRSKLTKDMSYPRPAWITDQATWDELMKDAKFKRKAHNNPNYRPFARGGSKRRLRDTTKATQARVSSIGSHKLGSGGYNSIRGGLVHQFQKEASDEDLKFALLHGSQGLRQHMLDRGEILVTGHEYEEAQQSNSSGSENEEELEEQDGLFVQHNDSTAILEPREDTILEFQQDGNKINEEGVQCDEQTTPTITIVPRRKRTQRKRMDRVQC